MKKCFKKVSVLLLAAIMVIGMALPALDVKAANDTAVGTVTNIPATATAVNAYKVIEPDTTSLSGYKDLTSGSIKDLNGETVDSEDFDATKIDWTTVDTTGLTAVAMTLASGVATADLEQGLYMVEITDSVNEYNPMALGINEGDSGLEAAETVAKPATTDIKKEAVPERTDDSCVSDLEVGDVVDFTITTIIPMYAQNATEPKFVIVDTLGEGLAFEGTPSYTIDGTAATDPAIAVSGQEMTLDLSAIALANRGATVELTYKAKITDAAATNADPNSNTVKLTYNDGVLDDSGNPGEDKYTADKTNHYTFEIDAEANGTGTPIDPSEHTDILKTSEVETGSDGTPSYEEELDGAIFNLYTTQEAAEAGSLSDDENTDGFFAQTTSANGGRLNFKGLDGNKVYYLREVQAPEGYKLNKDVVTVEVIPTYETVTELVEAASGVKVPVDVEKLASYVIKFDGVEAVSYTITNVSADPATGTDASSTPEDPTGSPYLFPNTELGLLPSTGGNGTALYTAIGAVVAFAGFMILSKARKRA